MKSKSTFSERIAYIREQEGMGLQEFCDHVGISIDTLKGIEYKGRDPRGSTLEKIARRFPKFAAFLLLGK